jgi:hypothetical protein
MFSSGDRDEEGFPTVLPGYIALVDSLSGSCGPSHRTAKIAAQDDLIDYRYLKPTYWSCYSKLWYRTLAGLRRNKHRACLLYGNEGQVCLPRLYRRG